MYMDPQYCLAYEVGDDPVESGVFEAEPLLCNSSYLAHEVGDDPVEGGVLEAETLLPGAESAEVLRGLGHHVSAQLNISINLCD